MQTTIAEKTAEALLFDTDSQNLAAQHSQYENTFLQLLAQTRVPIFPEKAATEIFSFGTAGYRSIEGFNSESVAQITWAIADYLISEMETSGKFLPILLGGDTRQKTQEALPVIAKILSARGLDVLVSYGDLPSPVLACAVKYVDQLGLGYSESAGALLLTASHNPWEYGGFNFLTPDAAVAPTEVTKQFLHFQQHPANKTLKRSQFGQSETAKIRFFDAFPLYKNHLEKTLKIDFQHLQSSGIDIFYDALYATGRNYLPRLLQEAGISIHALHSTHQRPAGFSGMPEPSREETHELAALMASDGSSHPLKVGLANDGDADRFGVLDENGRFLSPNDVLALILYHLLKNKKASGVVVRSQATSHLLDALAQQHQLSVIQTPVGYKYIAETFIEHEIEGKAPVIIGGESSGGLSVIHHVPEKDGILADLLIAELIATEKQPLSHILETLKNSVPLHFSFKELTIKTDKGKEILNYFAEKQQAGGTLGSFKIDVQRSQANAQALETKFGTRDGVKIYFEDQSWLLVRISGTEPLARLYFEVVDTSGALVQQKEADLMTVAQTFLKETFGVPSEQISIKL